MLRPRIPIGFSDTTVRPLPRPSRLPDGTSFYNWQRWKDARELFLRQHPLCECDECQAGKLKVTPSEVVDHIKPHRGDPALFWDTSNWQAMSKRHHDRKTARGE